MCPCQRQEWRSSDAAPEPSQAGGRDELGTSRHGSPPEKENLPNGTSGLHSVSLWRVSSEGAAQVTHFGSLS